MVRVDHIASILTIIALVGGFFVWAWPKINKRAAIRYVCLWRSMNFLWYGVGRSAPGDLRLRWLLRWTTIRSRVLYLGMGRDFRERYKHGRIVDRDSSSYGDTDDEILRSGTACAQRRKSKPSTFLSWYDDVVNNLSVRDLLKVFRKAVRRQDRSTLLRIAVRSMPRGGAAEDRTWKVHVERLRDELAAEGKMGRGCDLEERHIEMAAAQLMSTAWGIHPVVVLEQEGPGWAYPVSFLFDRRSYRRHTTISVNGKRITDI